MAKKSPRPEVAKPEPPLLESRLFGELTGLQNLTNKAVKVDGDTVSLVTTDTAVTGLTLTRALLKDVEAAKKAAIAEHLPPDVKSKLDRIDAEAKSIKTAAEKLEHALAGALDKAVQEGRITETVESSDGCKLMLTRKAVLVIDDEAKVPEAFTRKVLDLPAIEAALKEYEQKVAAAKVLELPPPASPVPGAHMGAKIILRTQAPELIEE